MEPSKKNKILIADQEEGNREALGLILRDFYDTIKINSPDDALAILAHNNNIFLVMLNLDSAVSDKRGLISQIKKIYPEIKFILVGGYKAEISEAEMIERGGHGYIKRPFIPEKIIQTIQGLT